MENVDSLEGHLLETGLVNCIRTISSWVVLFARNVLWVDLTIEPFGLMRGS